MKIITGYLTCTIFTGIVSQNYQRKMNAALSIGACISNKPFVFSSDLNIYISMAKRQGKVSFNGSFAYKHFSPLTLSSVTERLKGRKLWVLSGLSTHTHRPHLHCRGPHLHHTLNNQMRLECCAWWGGEATVVENLLGLFRRASAPRPSRGLFEYLNAKSSTSH